MTTQAFHFGSGWDIFEGMKKAQNTFGEFLFTSFDFRAKELNLGAQLGFSRDSTVTINQANHTISRIPQRPKVKYVK